LRFVIYDQGIQKPPAAYVRSISIPVVLKKPGQKKQPAPGCQYQYHMAEKKKTKKNKKR